MAWQARQNFRKRKKMGKASFPTSEDKCSVAMQREIFSAIWVPALGPLWNMIVRMCPSGASDKAGYDSSCLLRGGPILMHVYLFLRYLRVPIRFQEAAKCWEYKHEQRVEVLDHNCFSRYGVKDHRQLKSWAVWIYNSQSSPMGKHWSVGRGLYIMLLSTWKEWLNVCRRW